MNLYILILPFLVVVAFFLLFMYCNQDSYDSLGEIFGSLFPSKRRRKNQIYHSNNFYFSQGNRACFIQDSTTPEIVQFVPRRNKIISETENERQTCVYFSSTSSVTDKAQENVNIPKQEEKSNFPDIKNEKGGFKYTPMSMPEPFFAPIGNQENIVQASNHSSQVSSRENSPPPKPKPIPVRSTSTRSYDLPLSSDDDAPPVQRTKPSVSGSSESRKPRQNSNYRGKQGGGYKGKNYKGKGNYKGKQVKQEQ